MTDAQLLTVVYDVKGVGAALEAAGSTLSWKDASGEKIDDDFAKISTYYSLLRPHVRQKSSLRL